MCKNDGILAKTISSSTNHYFTTNFVRREVPWQWDGRITQASRTGKGQEWISSVICRVHWCNISWMQVMLMSQMRRHWDPMLPCCCRYKSAEYESIWHYCEHWHLTSTYHRMYNDVIHATRDKKQWEHRLTERVLPPLANKQPGQPKKNRIRLEDQHRRQMVVTCSNCR